MDGARHGRERPVAGDLVGGPVPLTVDREIRPFWEGIAKGQLRLPGCQACGRLRWPPRASCPSCHSLETGWTTVSGRGRIFTWTVIHRTKLKEYQHATPYAVAVVELAECAACREMVSLAPAADRDLEQCRAHARHSPIRMIGLLQESAGPPILIGQPVELHFMPQEEGVLFPIWRRTDRNSADQDAASAARD